MTIKIRIQYPHLNLTASADRSVRAMVHIVATMMKVLAISNLLSFWPNFSMINRLSKKAKRKYIYLIEASIGDYIIILFFFKIANLLKCWVLFTKI